MEKGQIKSKERVSKRGEVFTAEREVSAMCDLVGNMCEDYSKRFLEPACGNGNFLAEILRRKLGNVKKKYKRSSYDFERFSVFAVTSIYGVDIMKDNVAECRSRLFDIWDKEYKTVCKKEVNEQTREAVKYILDKNILCGNALTLMCVDENQQDTDTPIIFPEWSIVGGTNLKRRDFRLDVLLKVGEKPRDLKQNTVFDEQEDIYKYLALNPITGEYIAKPIREYPQLPYRRIEEND
ncbi:MAG: restriction endonuclease subunit M [Clostridia bacterium]|nr:restriction endonuclease subunit M [Clostridia bacterium]